MATGSRLTRYRDVATLGVGGTASVVLAEDTVLGRQVALKRMHPSMADRRGLVRLRREALVGASMTHPNLVSIYDVIDAEDGSAIIVMEYVEGETLRDRLKREGALAPPEALRVLAGVAAGLDAIHARGIVHRDVKPANVLLGADGRVKLGDLGIASVPDDTRITTAGTVLGSFRYMAPEQLKDGPATRAIDVYALAVMAFEAFSGRQARREANALAVAHAIAMQPPPDLRDVWPAAPAGAAEALMRGMCRDPAGRPASAGELVAALEAAFAPRLDAGPAPPASGPTASWPTGSGPTKTFRAHGARGRVLAPLALLLVAAGVLAALLSSGRRPSSRSHRSPVAHSTRSPSAARTQSRSRSPGATTSHASQTRAAAGTRSGAAAGTAAGTSAAGGGGSAGSPAIASGSSGSAAASGPGTPVAAVESFYGLAAAHRYGEAWSLADATFRRQLGGYKSFAAGQAADRSIVFDAARVIRRSTSSATVYVQTTSVRTTGIQRCSGTVELFPEAPSRWLLHTISIACS